MANSRIDQLTEATELTPADLLLLEQNSTAKKMTWNTFLGKTHAALTGQSGILRVTRRNLLDNSDFTNPVNQRMIVSGSEVPAYSYFLDRWATAGEAASPTFGPEGIGGISNDICQRLDLSAYIGKKVTLALYSDYDTVICFAAGTITANDGWAQIAASPNFECSIVSISANLWSCNFRVPCKYVALYEGEFTADTMPEYRPKGYGAELAECQRYFFRLTVPAWSNLAVGSIEGADTFQFKTQLLLSPFLVNPAVRIRCDGDLQVKYTDGTASAVFTVHDIVTMECASVGHNTVLNLKGISVLSDWKLGMLTTLGSSCDIDFTCEL